MTEKPMAVPVIIAGLLPIMFSRGTYCHRATSLLYREATFNRGVKLSDSFLEF